jgi:hypothetical protein
MLRRMTLLAMSLIAVLSVPSAGARPKSKTAAPKKDPLADYVQRVTGAAPAPAANTPGSLWIDNGRLADMVADYLAERTARSLAP